MRGEVKSVTVGRPQKEWLCPQHQHSFAVVLPTLQQIASVTGHENWEGFDKREDSRLLRTLMRQLATAAKIEYIPLLLIYLHSCLLAPLICGNRPRQSISESVAMQQHLKQQFPASQWSNAIGVASKRYDILHELLRSFI